MNMLRSLLIHVLDSIDLCWCSSRNLSYFLRRSWDLRMNLIMIALILFMWRLKNPLCVTLQRAISLAPRPCSLASCRCILRSRQFPLQHRKIPRKLDCVQHLKVQFILQHFRQMLVKSGKMHYLLTRRPMGWIDLKQSRNNRVQICRVFLWYFWINSF